MAKTPKWQTIAPLTKRKKSTEADSAAPKKSPNPYSAKNHKSAENMAGKQDGVRFILVWLLIMGFFGALFARAYYLQISHRDFYIQKGHQFATATIVTPVRRGMILDTTGVPLAADAPQVTVVFSPYDYALEYYERLKNYQNTLRLDAKKINPDTIAIKQTQAFDALDKLNLQTLATATNTSYEKLATAVALDDSIDVNNSEAVQNALPKGANSKYMPLLSNVTPEAAKAVIDLGIAGVTKDVTQRRFYTQAEPMAQVLGYMARSADDDAYKGRAGIEQKYEDILAGQPNITSVLRSSKGAHLQQLDTIQEGIDGQNIVLSIDARVQYMLYEALEEAGRLQQAQSASGIVVDAKTGEILAAASWPSFNANNLSTRTGATERNRVFLDTFEPGSVVKPITVAAALVSGKYNQNSRIDTNGGSFRIKGGNIKDSHNYGALSLAGLIQKSSNVASAKIALSLEPDSIANMQKNFGFGQRTTAAFVGESAGFVPMPTPKQTATIATLSYGYGQSVTLAQIAQAYTVFANQGVMRPLTLIKDEHHAPKFVLDENYARQIMDMMELVTEQGGTGQRASINGYRVAGKTGTSRRASPEGGYYADQYRALFAGIAPASDPRFVAAVVVENPRKSNYGGVVAAPVFSKVMQQTLRLYGVEFDKAFNTAEAS